MKKIKNVYQKLSALVWQEKDWHVAKCVEIEIASQGKTKQEALDNLIEALELYFENEPAFERIVFYNDISLEKINISYA